MTSQSFLIKITLYISLAILLWGCKSNKFKVDISDIDIDVEVVRFEEELFSLQSEKSNSDVESIRATYPVFFNLFTYKIIQIGGFDEPNFGLFLSKFIEDSLINTVRRDVNHEFSNFKSIEKKLNKAFKYYQYHFPQKEIPTIYTYISGFNQSIVVAKDILAIGLDKYLGSDTEYYQQLAGLPRYKLKNMNPENIPPDALYAWIMSEFHPGKNATRLIDFMIYNGKLMYLMDALFPEMDDRLKIGYTEDDIKWVEKNEMPMWTNIVENKLLYSTKRMDIIRFINDGPTTNGFPQGAPSRTGVWIGWQIVKKYMDQNPDMTLQELMDNYNYQEILSQSKYYPE